jgi:hypothetical protein
MAVVYYDSGTGATTGKALQLTSGLGDNKLCNASYYVKMTDPGAAGLIYFVFRYTDRDGTSQVHTSAALAIAGTAVVRGVVPFWSEDAAGQGAYAGFEITTVGALGSYEYEWWCAVDELGQGN